MWTRLFVRPVDLPAVCYGSTHVEKSLTRFIVSPKLPLGVENDLVTNLNTAAIIAINHEETILGFQPVRSVRDDNGLSIYVHRPRQTSVDLVIDTMDAGGIAGFQPFYQGGMRYHSLERVRFLGTIRNGYLVHA